MTGVEQNYGISVTGGTVKATAMAAGTQSTASVSNVQQPRSVEELRAELAALLEAVRAQASALPDGAQSVAVGQLASAELAKDDPDKHSFLGLMQSLAAGVGSIASLASAATSIQQAAASIF